MRWLTLVSTDAAHGAAPSLSVGECFFLAELLSSKERLTIVRSPRGDDVFVTGVCEDLRGRRFVIQFWRWGR